MSGLRGGLLAGALLAAAGATAWALLLKADLRTAGSDLNTARTEITREKAKTERAAEDAGRNLATANELKSILQRERESQTQLLKLQVELRQGLAQRERLIETLKNENAELRDWANQPIPDIARRLRERPALTGADAYRQWLSGRRAVPVAGHGAEVER